MKNFSKNLIHKSANLLGFQIVKTSNQDPVVNQDRRFIRIYNQCKDYSMTSKERMYSLYKAVEYIVSSKIPGDFVECGVWKGGSSMMVAYTLAELGATDRKIYLYDTFAGMTMPTENDRSIHNDNPQDVMDTWKRLQDNNHNNWAFAPLSLVKQNLSKTGYPMKNILFVQGKVEETIPGTVPKKIACLRLDTDWYESTKHELNHLFPLLSEGGH